MSPKLRLKKYNVENVKTGNKKIRFRKSLLLRVIFSLDMKLAFLNLFRNRFKLPACGHNVLASWRPYRAGVASSINNFGKLSYSFR